MPPNWGIVRADDDFFDNPWNYKYVDHPADH